MSVALSSAAWKFLSGDKPSPKIHGKFLSEPLVKEGSLSVEEAPLLEQPSLKDKTADLHIHTHFSDSTSAPQEVVEQAYAVGLSCISITDHDTVDGVAPTQLAAQELGIEVVAGIELSSQLNDKDIHILGYFVDIRNEILNAELTRAQDARIDRMRRMIEKLKDLGIGNITLEEVCILTKSKSVGRPHLAVILLQKGWVATLREAFEKYLGEGCPAYVEKYKMTPARAIELIRQAGGVAVLAHPMVTNRDELIPSFVEQGLQGIEVYYPNYSANTINHYEGIARKYHLIMTGGSDAHGKAKDNTYIGKVRVSYSVVQQLKEAAKKYS